MNISEISIINFKGLAKIDIAFDQETTIYGDNGTGKTSIADAISWLLFDKNQRFEKINPKPLNPDGTEKHNLETKVIAKIDGSDYCKIFREKWVKKRGQSQPEFQGHTTDYFIDGVPCKQKEWQEKIATIAEERAFKLLTNPYYFSSEMKWQDRRELLLEITGNIDDTDVMSRPELANLKSHLDGKTPEEYRKILTAKRSEINRHLQTIPARIDELSRIEAPKYDDALINSLQDATTRLQEEINNQTVSMGSAERSQIVTAQEEMAAIDRKYREEFREYVFRRDTIDRQIKEEDRNQKGIAKRIDAILNDIQRLRENYRAVSTGVELCPTCQQIMQSEAKSARLAEINRRGKQLRENLADLEKQHNEEHLLNLKNEYQSLKAPEVPDTQAISARIEKLKTAIASCDSTTIETLKIKMEEVKKALNTETDKKRQAEVVAKNQQRISELEAEEKTLNEAWERSEEGLYLLDLYTKLRISAVEQAVSEKFRIAGFKMFEEQINGGLNACCEVTCKGVPFNGGLNSGAQINVGLDIIKTLQEHYKLKMPVIVDNAESVTSLTDLSDTQIIRLVVSERDKTIRVEAHDERYRS